MNKLTWKRDPNHDHQIIITGNKYEYKLHLYGSGPPEEWNQIINSIMAPHENTPAQEKLIQRQVKDIMDVIDPNRILH